MQHIIHPDDLDYGDNGDFRVDKPSDAPITGTRVYGCVLAILENSRFSKLRQILLLLLWAHGFSNPAMAPADGYCR